MSLPEVTKMEPMGDLRTFAFHDEISPKKMTAEALESVPAAIRIAAGDLGCSLPESNDEADLVHLLVSYRINEMK